MVVLPPFQTLVDAHWRDVARVAAALAGPDDAEDAAQRAWVSALRAYPSLTSARNLRGWLLTIAANAAMDGHRSRARRPVPVAELPDRRRPPDPSCRSRALGCRSETCPSASAPRSPEVRRRPRAHGDRARARHDSRGVAPAGQRRARHLAQGPPMSDDLASHRLAARYAATHCPLPSRPARRCCRESDVSYAVVDAPVGPLVVAVTAQGVVSCSYDAEDAVLCAHRGARVAPGVARR
jgi:hypothetical protein